MNSVESKLSGKVKKKGKKKDETEVLNFMNQISSLKKVNFVHSCETQAIWGQTIQFFVLNFTKDVGNLCGTAICVGLVYSRCLKIFIKSETDNCFYLENYRLEKDMFKCDYR